MKLGVVIGVALGAASAAYIVANERDIMRVIKRSEKMLKKKFNDIVNM